MCSFSVELQIMFDSECAFDISCGHLASDKPKQEKAGK